MAVVAARVEQETKRCLRSDYCIELGILNNMPDGALERTERQFFTLLAAAAQDLLVRVRFFSLSTLKRDGAGREYLEHHGYARAAEIAGCDLDALIVTGTEPRNRDLRHESYWKELSQVFDWIAAEGPSTLFSCLGAHAAALHYDGVERRQLVEKRFGVFDHIVSRRDAMTEGLSSPFKIVHSRWNDVRESDLAACGYRILTWSAEAGVELFLKRGRRDFLFCQGHPEYDTQTLAREYRRDVRRWLAGQTGAYPHLPTNYFSSVEIVALEQFRLRAEFARTEALMAEFPSVARRQNARWNDPGVALFRSWLKMLVENRRANRFARTVTAAPALDTQAA